MKKRFCDRCGAEIQLVGHVNLGLNEDAEENGDGSETFCCDLCRRCTKALKKWIATEPK